MLVHKKYKRIALALPLLELRLREPDVYTLHRPTLGTLQGYRPNRRHRRPLVPAIQTVSFTGSVRTPAVKGDDVAHQQSGGIKNGNRALL